jgi:hypothetical protein
VPAAVVGAAARVIVFEPFGITVGIPPGKLAVAPAGWPVTVIGTGASQMPEVMVSEIVMVPLLPCATEREVGEAETVKT